jgi:hypothetical protein
MALEPYDVITSLGSWCAPAANIRRRFGVSQAMPFDWWVSPYNATIKLLEEDFGNLLRPENLEIVDNGDSVRCNYYGILHHHDFIRDDSKRIVPEFGSQIGAVAEKFRFIVDRFHRTHFGKRALFVRHSLNSELWQADSGIPFESPTAEEQIERATRLHCLIRSRLSPSHADVIVLSDLRPGTTLALEGGSVIFEQLGEQIDDSVFWNGNYDHLFSRLGIVLASA